MQSPKKIEEYSNVGKEMPYITHLGMVYLMYFNVIYTTYWEW